MVVYLVRAGETDLYKIGYTSQSPRERVVAMQTGCPHRLKLVGAWKGSEDDEKMIHADLESVHVRGEWFELEPDKVVDLCCNLTSGALQGGGRADPVLVILDEYGPDNSQGKVVIDEVLQRIMGRFGPLEDQHVLFPSSELVGVAEALLGEEEISPQGVWAMIRPLLGYTKDGELYKARTDGYRGLAWEGRESDQTLGSWFGG